MKEGSIVREADAMLSGLFSKVKSGHNESQFDQSKNNRRMSGAELIQFAFAASESEWAEGFKELVPIVSKRHALGKQELNEILSLSKEDIIKAPTELARHVGLSFKQIEVVKHARQESARNFMEREIIPTISPKVSLDELLRSRAARSVVYEFEFL